MFTTFKNVKFVTADLAGFEVADSVLLIFTKNRTLELFFDSNEEARLAEQELEKLLIAQQYAQPETEKPTGSILDDITGLFKSTKANVFDGALSKAQDLFGKKPKEKVKSEFDFYGTLAAVLVQSASNTAQSKVADIVKDLTASLEEVLDKVSTVNSDKETAPDQPKPAQEKKTECTRPSPAPAQDADRKVNIKRNDVFGARTASSSDVPTMPKECYMVIGDMTSPQLKAAIDNVLVALMSTEKCQSLFGNIRKQFGEEATQDAVNNFKEIVYTKCTENVDSTIAEVLTKHFL